MCVCVCLFFFTLGLMYVSLLIVVAVLVIGPASSLNQTRSITLLALQSRLGDKILTEFDWFVPKTGLQSSKSPFGQNKEEYVSLSKVLRRC